MLFVYIFLYFRCFPWLLTSKMLMQMERMMNRNLFRTWVCFSVHSWRSMVSWWKRRYFNLLNTQILHTVFYTFPFALMRRILLLTCGYPMRIPRVFLWVSICKCVTHSLCVNGDQLFGSDLNSLLDMKTT